MCVGRALDVDCYILNEITILNCMLNTCVWYASSWVNFSQEPVEGTGSTENLFTGRCTRKILPFEVHDYINFIEYHNHHNAVKAFNKFKNEKS